ncbi:MAG: hypothetical protein WAV53_16350 [Anaerolineae bacterium]|uniref:hypothetical protein n=1 Tax=Candidatus Amarolinea dominans TaxID=3140696 RepID=UPI0031350803|nr:hypothetical protein [Anaerolineae bacterium]
MPSPLPASLPADLQARLAAAGVRDTTDLPAALDRDPALRAAWMSFLAEYQDEIVQAALLAFLSAPDFDALQTLAGQAPFILEEGFSETVNEVIAQAEEAEETDFAESVRLRLAGLRQIKAGMALSPLAQALMAFVQAPDDAAASAVFAAQRQLLLPQEAQRSLEDHIRSNDPTAQDHLAGRRRLLHRLRQGEP